MEGAWIWRTEKMELRAWILGTEGVYAFSLEIVIAPYILTYA